MEVNAQIAKGATQIRIQKMGKPFTSLMTVADARRAHEQGRITKMNKCMQRLIDNDFDVTKTLGWYQEERDRIRNESSTDET